MAASASGSLVLASIPVVCSAAHVGGRSCRAESLLQLNNGFLGAKFEGLSLRRWESKTGAGLKGFKVEASAAVLDGDVATKFVPRLRRVYLEKVVPALKEEFKYQNPQEVPYVKKVVINCGVGEAAQNAKALESCIRDLSLITGQKPVTTRAKKAIAGFKLREGVAVGVSLTLRGEVMYAFLDRLLNLALPRTRDFQGVNPSGFDGKGNFNLGVREQSVFPEIRFENIDRERGMDVSIVNSARNDTEGQKLLALLGMPFKSGAAVRTAAAARRKARDTYKGTTRKSKKK